MRSDQGMRYEGYGDETLLALVARRDAVAFETLYRRHAGLARLLILRILGDVEDAEESLQEAFSRVWLRADSYRPTGAGPRAWIVAIARNSALDRLRRRNVRPRTESLDGAPVPLAEVADDPAEASVRAEIGRRVQAALRDLSEEQREALELAYFSGLTQREIAERTRSPLGTVKSRMRLAMRHLRDRLEPLMAEGFHA
ncbi:MAG TPA: sigma-70 family RNA polymerase sigma factor [Candidatus Dormibacteraeota bacterium]|nr:sigma-70 family RNA polymerase sigma factor [Candidatus Dormibacteraeota bacterium]